MKTLDEAVEYAAEKLPKDCIVNIRVEKHGYGVELEISTDDLCSEVLSVDGDSIAECIVNAVDMAPDYI